MSSPIISMARASLGKLIILLDKVENKKDNAAVCIFRCEKKIFLMTKRFERWVNFEEFSGNIKEAHEHAFSLIHH